MNECMKKDLLMVNAYNKDTLHCSVHKHSSVLIFCKFNLYDTIYESQYFLIHVLASYM